MGFCRVRMEISLMREFAGLFEVLKFLFTRLPIRNANGVVF